MFHTFASAQKAAVVAAFWPVLVLPALAEVTVTKATNLSFGKLVPGTSSGTVTISTSGGRSASSSVALFNQSSVQHAAVFNVSGGTGGASCTLTVPSSAPADLAGSKAGSMGLSNFLASNVSFVPISLSNSTASITLDGAGGYTVNVGATLAVGASQVAGDYTSSISVTVTCP